MTDPQFPVDEAPNIPGEWGVDEDSYTEEDGFTDGVPDDVDKPLPVIEEE